MSVFRSAVEAFNGIWGGNLTVQGDLTVNGTATFDIPAVSSSLTITVNNGEAGTGITPPAFAGLVIDRGLATDFQFGYDESSATFKSGLVGAMQDVTLWQAVASDTQIPYMTATGLQGAAALTWMALL